MQNIVFPFTLQRKCCGKVHYLNKMKSLRSIEIYERLCELQKYNEFSKHNIVSAIEEEIPKEENRNKLINIKRDIFNNRYSKILNHEIVIHNKELLATINKYRTSVLEMISLQEQLVTTFDFEYNNSRELIQRIYKESDELRSGLKHVSLSAYEKIDKYISIPASNHSTTYRKFDRTLAKIITRATLKPSPFTTFSKVRLMKLDKKKITEEKEAKDIVHLEINDTYVLRLFNNFLRLPEIITKCDFRLEKKIAISGETIQTIYEYDKKSNSKVYGTSSRYVKLPYKGNLKLIYDSLYNKDRVSFKEIVELIKNGQEESANREFICKCVDMGLLSIVDVIDAAQEDLLAGCIKKIKSLMPEGSLQYIHLIRVLEELQSVKDKYNETSIELEKILYFKEISALLKEAFECIEITIPLENLVYEDYINLSIGNKKFEAEILNNLEWLCKLSALFDINLRTQLYFADMYKKIFGEQIISYKHPQIMALLTNATKKYADLWTNEWDFEKGEDASPEIKLLDKKKNIFREYLLSSKDKDVISLDTNFLNDLLGDIPHYLIDRNVSMDFFIQELVDDNVVMNNIYPGYLTFISRFLDYFEDEEIARLKNQYINEVFNKDYKIAEIYEIYGFNANRHRPIADNRIVFDQDAIESKTLFKNNISAAETYLSYNKSTHLVNFINKEQEIFFPKHIGSLITVLMKGEHAFINNISTNVLTLPPIYKIFLKKDEGIVIMPRVVLGHVILSRKRWCIPYHLLPKRTDSASALDYFFNMRNWLRKNGIPYSVYVKFETETTPMEEDVDRTKKDYSANKPQYIDFDNPILVDLFDNMCQGCSYALIDEAVPDYVNDMNLDSAEEYVVELTRMSGRK